MKNMTKHDITLQVPAAGRRLEAFGHDGGGAIGRANRAAAMRPLAPARAPAERARDREPDVGAMPSRAYEYAPPA